MPAREGAEGHSKSRSSLKHGRAQPLPHVFGRLATHAHGQVGVHTEQQKKPEEEVRSGSQRALSAMLQGLDQPVWIIR